jgi:4-hydroxybenzoate polyprenyltransferase
MSVGIRPAVPRPGGTLGLPLAFSPARHAALVLTAMRPRQWPKNLFVLAPVLFTGKLGDPGLLLRSLAAAACFCGLSGAVYLVNDLCDRRRDALHPVKRHRPVASGRLGPAAAALAAALLGGACLAAAALLGGLFPLVAGSYLVLMLAYSTVLKNVVLADVLGIATGFVLRALAGGVVIGVPVSEWLLICTALVSLFMALGKRRYELRGLRGGAAGHRPVLENYNEPLLDQLIGVTATGSLVSYLLYCVLSQTAQAHDGLLLTAPFVAYGLFRYLYCVYRCDGGGSPEDVIFKDRVFLVTGAAYACAVLGVLYLL